MSAFYNPSKPPRPCAFYAAGTCMFGDGCRFSHVKADTSSRYAAPLSASSTNHHSDSHPHVTKSGLHIFAPSFASGGNGTENIPCKYWKLGSCQFGSGCRFSHETAATPAAKQSKCDRKESWRAEKPTPARDASEPTLLREVDNCLVTFGAGLSVKHVISSFDVARGRLVGLPTYLKAEEVIGFLNTNGVDASRYTLHKPTNSGFAFICIDSSLVPRLQLLPSLEDSAVEFIFSKVSSDADAESGAFGRTLIVQIPASTPSAMVTSLSVHLKGKARSFGFQSITREIPPPGARSDLRIRIRITLDSWDHALNLRDTLRRQGTFSTASAGFSLSSSTVKLNNFFLPYKYRYPLYMSASQHGSQEDQWDDLAERCKKEKCQLKFSELADSKMQVTLLGNELSSVGPMKTRAEELVRGTVVNLWSRSFFDDSVTQKLTNDVQDTTGAFVQFDRRFKCLRVFGSSAAVDKAHEQLQAHAEQLSKTEYVRELPTQQATRFFIEHVYPQLMETYGDEAVKLDLTSTPKRVIVTGDEEIRHRLNKLFDEDTTIRPIADGGSDGANDSQDCPICMCPVTVPTALDCDHVYCTQCLTHLVKSALESTSFPLTCSADEGRCAMPISISLLEKFLHATKFRQLLEVAFHTYLEQNPDGIFPCKTPGCTQLYARDASGKEDGSKTVRCPSCFVAACASCGKNAHPGVSCDNARRDLSEEYIDSSSDIHRCPSCQTPIFKDGGCNHVSCRCGKHICWRCMEVFPASGPCYSHMSRAHGGCFDNDMVAENARHRGRDDAPFEIPEAFVEEDIQARTLGGMFDRLERIQLGDRQPGRGTLGMRRRSRGFALRRGGF